VEFRSPVEPLKDDLPLSAVGIHTLCECSQVVHWIDGLHLGKKVYGKWTAHKNILTREISSGRVPRQTSRAQGID